MQNKESGAIILWMAIVLTVILGILSFLYFSSSLTTVRSELQTAANAAALAGAKTLCSRSDCYNEVRSVIQNVLSAHSTHGLSNLDFIEVNTTANPNVPVPPLWTNSNIEITIERGWWRKNITEDDLWPGEDFNEFYFTSVEGDFGDDGWSEARPGVPAHVIANAVRVTIRADEVGSLFNLDIGNVSAPVQVVATAISGPVDAVEVAPFALPVCSILSDQGEFEPGEICYGDRLFTRADRYMPEDKQDLDILPFGVTLDEFREGLSPLAGTADSAYTSHYGYNSVADVTNDRRDRYQSLAYGVRPTFFYGPCSDDINECNISRQINYSFDKDNTVYDNEYKTFGWANYAYSNIADHYGVVGRPKPDSDNSDVSENNANELIDIVGSSSRNESGMAEINQEFQILREGFTSDTIDINTSLENAIQSSSRIPPTSDPHKSSDPRWDLAAINGDITISTNRLLGLMPFVEDFANLLPLPDTPLPFNTGVLIDPTTVPAANSVTSPPADNHFHNSVRVGLNTAPDANLRAEYPTYQRDNYSHGFCKSNRMKLSCAGNSSADVLAGNTTGCEHNLDEHMDSSTFIEDDKRIIKDYLGKNIEFKAVPIDPEFSDKAWRIKVPIIADFDSDAEPCEGIDRKLGEAPIAADGTTDYRIIGFTTVDIFDYDINSTPTNVTFTPEQDGDYSFSTSIETDNISSILTTYDYVIEHYLNNPEMGSVMSNAADEIKIPNISVMPSQSLNFQVEGQDVPCNLVRARAACDTNFIPSSKNEGTRSARLVNAPIN